MRDPDFDAWLTEVGSLPRAACVLVRKLNGLILGVSRRGDPDAFGLPGGKVEPGEIMAEAAVRELREEMGLVLASPRLIRIYVTDPGRDGKSFACGAYEGDVTGEIRAEEGLRVEWVSARTLVAGPFGNYNSTLFKRPGIL